MSATAPEPAHGLEVHETEGGLIVYMESTDRVHHLNQTAAVIFSLCDGTMSLEEIAEGLGEVFSLPEPPLVETIACVERLEREGLVC